MDNPDPLSELADIHLPEPVGLWPLAPGWWVLAAIVLVGGFFLIRYLRADARTKRLKRFAIVELDKCLAAYQEQSASASESDQAQITLNYVSEINAVLRRVALKHYPYGRIASLSGDDWISFLRNGGDASLLDDSIASAIKQGRFAKQWDIDADALYNMAHRWIESLYIGSHSTTSHHHSPTNEKAVS